MSKNTAAESTQNATVTAPQAKKERKPLFGLSAEDLSMVVGGTGVIVGGPQSPNR